MDDQQGEHGREQRPPVKIYRLAKPIHEIMDRIEKEKKKKANEQLALVQKFRDYFR